MAKVIPPSGKERDYLSALKRVLSSAWFGNDVSYIDPPPSCLNGEYITGVNAAGTGTVKLIGVDEADNVLVGGNVVSAFYKSVVFRSGNTGAQSGRQFWISDGFYTVTGVQEIHSVPEVTAPVMVANINKLNATTNSPLNSATMDCKAAANTLQVVALSPQASILALDPGDRLVWTTTTATPSTELAGVCAVVLLSPGNRNNQVSYYFNNASAVDNCFFVANRPMTISRIDYMHGTAATGPATCFVTLDTGTAAPGTGAQVNTFAFNCAATANVVQTRLPATVNRMNPGDRLSAEFSGTLTNINNGVLTVSFAPYTDRKDIVYHGILNANHLDAYFFIADRPYEVEAASAAWSTPASAGSNAQLTIDNGTQVPGGGLNVLTNDTNAGFQIDGTANTVELGTLVTFPNRFMQTGDRLSMDFTAITNLVNFVCVVTLRPA